MGPEIEETEMEDRGRFESIDKSLKQVCWLLLMILLALGGVVAAVIGNAPK